MKPGDRVEILTGTFRGSIARITEVRQHPNYSKPTKFPNEKFSDVIVYVELQGRKLYYFGDELKKL
jgi:transcription antitermination factor NusG